MKTFIYALAVAVPLSAAPVVAGVGSATAADTNPMANSVSQPDDERNAPLAAQLEDAQHGVGPTFGNDDDQTPPALEQGQSGSSGQSGGSEQGGITIAPYPNSERPAFERGR